MSRFLITIEVTVSDPEALEKAGLEAARGHGFTPETWRAYRAERGGSAADLLEWLPHGPPGTSFERMSCEAADAA